jgi:hypothetical protein
MRGKRGRGSGGKLMPRKGGEAAQEADRISDDDAAARQTTILRKIAAKRRNVLRKLAK